MRVGNAGRQRGGGSGKGRSAECRNCLFLQSLVKAKVPAETVNAVCERMWLNKIPRRHVLHLEGNRASHLYAIRAGRVKLVKVDAMGREHVTAILESGDLFGLEAAFDSAYSSAAEAMTECEVCLVSASDLKTHVARLPGFALALTRYLHEQLRRAQERLVYLHFPGATAKLAGFLVHTLPAGADAPLTVPFDLSLRELGGALGIAPETACRALRRLVTAGIIERTPGRIRIRDLGALRARAGLS